MPNGGFGNLIALPLQKGPRAEHNMEFLELTHQLGCVDYSRPRRFRAMLDQRPGTISKVWPECLAKIDARGEHLVIAHQTAIAPAAGQMRHQF